MLQSFWEWAARTTPINYVGLQKNVQILYISQADNYLSVP